MTLLIHTPLIIAVVTAVAYIALGLRYSRQEI